MFRKSPAVNDRHSELVPQRGITNSYLNLAKAALVIHDGAVIHSHNDSRVKGLAVYPSNVLSNV